MKKIHIIGIILIAISIAAIIVTITDSSTYASFSVASKDPGVEYYVIGKLNKEKELYYKPEEDANLFAFFLIDSKGEERKVIYRGAKPQDFERSEQIVVTGKIEDNNFHASQILMKCPSKYNGGKEELREFRANS